MTTILIVLYIIGVIVAFHICMKLGSPTSARHEPNIGDVVEALVVGLCWPFVASVLSILLILQCLATFYTPKKKD